MSIYIRVNGRGNAFPLVRGRNASRNIALRKEHREYSNTSLSIVKCDGNPQESEAEWEVLFDMGQGVISTLAQSGHVPDAMIFSHPHFDHFSGLDWLIAMYTEQFPEKRLPAYASKPCWDKLKHTFDYMDARLEWREVKPAQRSEIPEAPGLSITSFPNFHGDTAPGACTTVLEYSERGQTVRAILTGDVMCPLLRVEDYQNLQPAKVIYVDSNTRFPNCPSGHWSIGDRDPGRTDSPALEGWFQERGHPSYLTAPHSRDFDEITFTYLDEYVKEIMDGVQLPCTSVFEFARRIKPESVQLVHYGGYEDLTRYGEDILTDAELSAWATKEASKAGVPVKQWDVPPPGSHFQLLP